MRPVAFSAAALGRLGVATVPKLVDALGSPSRGTVFRKLRELDALSSYSHCGQYYTLRASARFDAHGLWAHGEIRFSAHGTLLATVAALTASAPRGWRASELDELVGVNARGALHKLVRAEALACVRVDGRSLYCATDPARQRRQIAARRSAGPSVPLRLPPARLAAVAHRFVSLLEERQRRLFAGPLALPHGCARRPGGGRKPLVKKARPERTPLRAARQRDRRQPHGRPALDAPFGRQSGHPTDG